MLTSEKIDEIAKDALVEWKSNLEHQIEVLEKELVELRTKEVELSAKYQVAYKAYFRTMDEEVQKYIHDPLKEELEEFRQHMNEKIAENNSKIGAMGTVILNIEAKLKIM
jgi:DNA anti-recombination protein RmuC